MSAQFYILNVRYYSVFNIFWRGQPELYFQKACFKD